MEQALCNSPLFVLGLFHKAREPAKKLKRERMKAIDRKHFFALENLRKQIAKDKDAGKPKKVYLVELDERHEIKPDDADGLGTYHDAYGVWFGGSLGAVIKKRSGFLHAFLTAKPEKLQEGISELTCYGIPSILYFWRSQGYNRGVIIAINDTEETHAEANRLLDTRPWDFTPIFKTVAPRISIIMPAYFTPQPMFLTFSKYSGKTLEELAGTNRHYLEWISENCKDEKITTRAKQLLGN